MDLSIYEEDGDVTIATKKGLPSLNVAGLDIKASPIGPG